MPLSKEARIETNRRYRVYNRYMAASYLSCHPCVDCGESDILVLDFDHIRDKQHDIGVMLTGTYRWETILEEINKCEVRCANCHRRVSAIRRGTDYKLNILDFPPPAPQINNGRIV